MNAKDMKQYRDSTLQKIYELARHSTVVPVQFDDLERETGMGKDELLHVVSYFHQKNFLRLEPDLSPDVLEVRSADEPRPNFLHIEPYILLTADGIDYCENGFINSSPHPPDTYNTTFEREVNGPVQLGGSDNTQENSVRVGLATPQEAPTTVAATFPELEETDIRVLKAACEEVIRRDERVNSYIQTDTFAKKPGLAGLSDEDINESLQLLMDEGYINPFKSSKLLVLFMPLRLLRQSKRRSLFIVTLDGFERYASVFIADYKRTFLSVISRIVDDGDRNNKQIAAALNQPLVIVSHILEVLRKDQKIELFYVQNTDLFKIVDVKPHLKRMLKRS